jgi:hypothetical protein
VAGEAVVLEDVDAAGGSEEQAASAAATASANTRAPGRPGAGGAIGIMAGQDNLQEAGERRDDSHKIQTGCDESSWRCDKTAR